MVGQHVDISEQKAVQQREADLARIVDDSVNEIYVFSAAEYYFLHVNRVAVDNLGYDHDELLSMTPVDLKPQFTLGTFKEMLTPLTDGAEQMLEFETSHRRKNGTEYPVEVHLQSHTYNGQVAFVAVILDISSRKAHEAAARESDKRLQAQDALYRNLVETTSAILWEADAQTFEFSFVNRMVETVLGYPAEEWVGNVDFWPSHIHPEDRDWVVQRCVDATAKCEAHTLEYRMLRADGGTVWLRDIIDVIPEDGKPSRLVGAMIDITREKKEEERFQTVFENLPIGGIVAGSDWTIQLMNPAAREMFGLPEGEQTDRVLSDLIPSLAADRSGDTVLTTREVDGVRSGGTHFPLQIALGEMEHIGGTRYVCSVMDLSHVKNLEAQLTQAQKMEAVGQLAGGIAHDFNNLLHVINGYVELAQLTLEPDAPVHDELKHIAEAGERAAALTSQLLAFSRRQVMKPSDIDVNAVVMRVVTMVGRIIGEDIKLDVITGTHVASVFADSGMLEQVLMNLCVNARDAMPNGGQLTIETENVIVNEGYAKDHVWARPGRYVLISVTDSGSGMTQETLDHVFEPFYTTKSSQRGTGLGLSMAYGIVKQHDGMINAYSEIEKGTIFKVYLPHSERPAEDVGTKIEGAVPTGTETVLVVEDDESVRQLTRSILEDGGYTVVEACNGRKAVQYFKEHHTDIHLALLDVVMPDMGGREALDGMIKIDPSLKAIFASGYSENAIHTNFVLDSGLTLLNKPYSRDELLRAVRALLDTDNLPAET